MQQNNNIHVKLQFKNEFRRFTVPACAQFSDLKERIETVIPGKIFVLSYLDDENEWIVLSNDDELRIAISLSPKILRVQMTLVSEKSTTSSDTTSEELRPKWERKREKKLLKTERKCRKKAMKNEDCENDVTSAECPKFRKHCKKNWKKGYDASECPRFKKHFKFAPNEECDTISAECPRFKRHCKFAAKEESDTISECQRFRRWGRRSSMYAECPVNDDGSGEHSWKRGGRHHGGYNWRKHCKKSSERENDEKLTPEASQKVITSIKEEVSLLKEKLKAAKGEAKELKEKIKQARLDGEEKNSILELRTAMQEKKKAVWQIKSLIRASKQNVAEINKPSSESDE